MGDIAPFLTKYYDAYLVINVFLNFLCDQMSVICKHNFL